MTAKESSAATPDAVTSRQVKPVIPASSTTRITASTIASKVNTSGGAQTPRSAADSNAMPPPPPGYPVPARPGSRPAASTSSGIKASHLPPNTAKRPVTTIASSTRYTDPSSAITGPQPQITTPAPPPQQQGASPPYLYDHKSRPQLLRRGKWTTEEEEYASRLIHLFKSGLLPLTDGTTLRNFLSKLLNCDPMRISKKFVGNNCIGKQVFRRRAAEMGRLGEGEMRRSSLELSELEQRFLDRVASTNRVKPHTHPPQISTYGSPHSTHIRRNYIEDDRDRPPTPPWLKPPSTYVSKRPPRNNIPRKKLRVAPPGVSYQQPLAQPLVAQPATVTSARPTVTIAKLDTEKAMNAISKSTKDEPIKRSESALEQLARTASAAKFVEDIVSGDLGDIHIKGAKLSSLSLQGSFQALMSLDMESVENLAQLSSLNMSSDELNKLAESHRKGSGFKSSSRMESFIKNLSNANLKTDSAAALSNLFSNLQKNSIADFDDGKFKQVESSTGLSNLRAVNGLTSSHHDSIEDFLSLMKSGDIPHEDANMLNVPLQKVMGSGSLSSKLSQHQLLKLASRASLAKLASKSNLSESLSDLAAACSSATSGGLKKRKRGDAAS
ncbi:hypothetical protein ACHAWO_012942 [Cyclotella atomus]|uniref:Uncharacterized protein n=1 Tax=Cyclotella atomus TaxID=382360 RepID=A0ABD3PB57_9STRA